MECKKCEEFDQETSDKMRALFGREEILITASSLVSFLITLTMQMNKMKKSDPNNLKRFHFRRDVDIAQRTIGKFITALEPADRKAFVNTMEKQSGIKLAINHEACPHTEEKKDEQQTASPN